LPIFVGRGAPLGYSEGLAGVRGFKQDSRSVAVAPNQKYQSRARSPTAKGRSLNKLKSIGGNAPLSFSRFS